MSDEMADGQLDVSLVSAAASVLLVPDWRCAMVAEDLLKPRAFVTLEELALMPPSLTPAEALPWARKGRSGFYKALAEGEIASCRLGRSIRIPTRRYLIQLDVLEEDRELKCPANPSSSISVLPEE